MGRIQSNFNDSCLILQRTLKCKKQSYCQLTSCRQMFSQGSILVMITVLDDRKQLIRFFSCHLKDETTYFNFICRVSQFCLVIGQEKLLWVISYGERTMKLRSSIFLDMEQNENGVFFLLSFECVFGHKHSPELSGKQAYERAILLLFFHAPSMSPCLYLQLPLYPLPPEQAARIPF